RVQRGAPDKAGERRERDNPARVIQVRQGGGVVPRLVVRLGQNQLVLLVANERLLERSTAGRRRAHPEGRVPADPVQGRHRVAGLCRVRVVAAVGGQGLLGK